MSLAGPHDRLLPRCPRQIRAQRPVPHALPFPRRRQRRTGATVTQRTHNAGEAGDRPPRLPTAETEMFTRGCPTLTPGARSSHDQAPDRWDQANA